MLNLFKFILAALIVLMLTGPGLGEGYEFTDIYGNYINCSGPKMHCVGPNGTIYRIGNHSIQTQNGNTIGYIEQLRVLGTNTDKNSKKKYKLVQLYNGKNIESLRDWVDLSRYLFSLRRGKSKIRLVRSLMGKAKNVMDSNFKNISRKDFDYLIYNTVSMTLELEDRYVFRDCIILLKVSNKKRKGRYNNILDFLKYNETT